MRRQLRKRSPNQDQPADARRQRREREQTANVHDQYLQTIALPQKVGVRSNDSIRRPAPHGSRSTVSCRVTLAKCRSINAATVVSGSQRGAVPAAGVTVRKHADDPGSILHDQDAGRSAAATDIEAYVQEAC
jgi:hypothetical protein